MRRIRNLIFLGFCAALVVTSGTLSLAQEAVRDRFFLAGDGTLQVRRARDGTFLEAPLVHGDGSLNDAGVVALSRLLGFPADSESGRISLRLLFMLDHFTDRLAPGKVITIESGYRSPAYNETLRKTGGNVAPTSTHVDGMAVDFSVEGVAGKEIWEAIRQENCCGVGHYGGKTVHLDAGKPRFWEAATSGVRTGASEFNRRIYLSTEYDRYRPGETVALALSSVSDFPFGVKKRFTILKAGGEKAGVAEGTLGPSGSRECIPVTGRRESQMLRVTLPEGISPGRYRVEVEFCRIPFREMPPKTISNEIEIVAGR